jgi:hypothetical protein
MNEYLLQIPRNKRGKILVEFLRQIDYINIKEATPESIFKLGIEQSILDLKSGKTTSWKNKTIRLKNA